MNTILFRIRILTLLAAIFCGSALQSHAQDAYDDGSRYAPGRSTSAAPEFSKAQQKEILQALQNQGVYVSPGMRSQADPNALAKSARDYNAKILVLDALPGRAPIGKVAENFHKALNMGDGLMIVAVGGSRPQVAANGGNRVSSASELGNIVKSQAAIFGGQGYTQGIQAILKAHQAAEKSAGTSSGVGLLFLVGVPAAGGVWYFRRKKSQDAARELRLRDETRTLSNELAPQYEKLDSDFEYAIIAADPDRQRELREARNDAGKAFSDAMKQFNNAQTFQELLGARAALMRARDAHDRSRAILEGRPLPEPQANTQISNNGPGSMLPPAMQNQNSNADEPFEIGPLGQGYAGARPGYGLDFFTSEPVPLDEMVPVDIDVNGQKRRVWASHDSAQRALSGQAQVATVQSQGQNVPWYQAPQQYNPWQDFGSTMLTMMAMNMMMNTMFSPFGYGGGFGGGFDHHHHGGYGGGYDNGGAMDSGGWVNTNDDSNSGVADLDLFGGGGDSGGFDAGGLFDGGGFDDSSSGVADLDLFN